MPPLRDDCRPQPPVLTDVAAPAWPADQPQPAPFAVPDPTPGAYVPPSPVITAGPALPAREYAGANGGPAGAAAAALASDASAAKDETGRLDALDPAKVAEFIDWMAVAGAALAAVGFVLPWSVTVIGSSGVDYFERWGLAGPGHPLIVIALLAILVLAILHNPIPAWIRVGIAGLAVGSFLLGMLWPYVVGPLGALPGAIASLVGTCRAAGRRKRRADRASSRHVATRRLRAVGYPDPADPSRAQSPAGCPCYTAPDAAADRAEAAVGAR